MSSLVTITYGHEVATEKKFRQRIEEFKQMVYRGLDEIRSHSKNLDKDIQEVILTVFSERLN